MFLGVKWRWLPQHFAFPAQATKRALEGREPCVLWAVKPGEEGSSRRLDVPGRDYRAEPASWGAPTAQTSDPALAAALVPW